MLQQNDLNANNRKSSQNDHLDLDQITKKKIDKHLTDINDQISEEDIKNVNTNINSDNIHQSDNDHFDNEDIKKTMPTSWQVEE